jgi:hypothetical protein
VSFCSLEYNSRPSRKLFVGLLTNQGRGEGDFRRDAWPCVSTGGDGKNKDGLTTANGIYFYQIVSEGFAETKKMIFVK